MTDAWSHTIAYWHAGGLLLVPIGLVCFGIWFCFLRSRHALVRIWKEGLEVERVLQEEGSKQGDLGDLGASMQRIGSGFADMVRRAVDDMLRGTPPLRAFTKRETQCLRLLRRDMVVLSALTVVAPLLGLLGTVMGMIETFDAVSMISGHTANRVAAGISRALITTQFGLVVALPGVFGISRLQRMLNNVEAIMAACRSQSALRARL